MMMEITRLAFFFVVASLSVCSTFGRHNKDPCDGYYCANGGVCILENGYEYRRRLAQPTCQCAGAWKGERCDDNPCDSVSCNGGNCFTDSNGSAHCCCPIGTTGHFCEIEENPCDTVDCNDGTCNVEEDGSTSCLCPEFVTGEFCEIDQRCTEQCKQLCIGSEVLILNNFCPNGDTCCSYP